MQFLDHLPESKDDFCRNLKGIKICLVAGSIASVGGTEIYVYESILALVECGAEVLLIVSDPEIPASIARLNNIEIFALSASDFNALTLSKLHGNSSNNITMLLKLQNCDVVIFHSLAPVLLIKKIKAKTIFAYHLPSHLCPAGTRFLPKTSGLCTNNPGLSCIYSDIREGCLRRSYGGKFPVGMLPETLLFKQRSLERLDAPNAVLFNSYAMRDAATAILGRTPKAKQYVIHPPLINDEINNAVCNSLYHTKKDRLILFVGRLDAPKGCDDAIRLLVGLPEDISLRIIGDGPARPALEILAAELCLTHRVYFAGWQDTNSVFQEMRTASCLVMPSKWFEAFGMVGIQALAAGCPVVAYDVGGIKEWGVSSGVTLVPVSDLKSMRTAVSSYLNGCNIATSKISLETVSRWGKLVFRMRTAEMVTDIVSDRATMEST